MTAQTHQIINFLFVASNFWIVIAVAALYIYLSIWYNTRRTKINTDRMVKLLEVYMYEKMTSENKKELIYGYDTLDTMLIEKHFSNK